MEIGDIVRVARQPKDLPARVEGTVAFIQDIKNDYASIQSFGVDGSTGGGGCVPLACLVPETSPTWIEGKRLYEERLEALLKEGRAFSARVNVRRDELAKKYGITPKDIDDIRTEMAKMYP